MVTKLDRAISRFRKENPWVDDPAEVDCQCLAVSCEFAEFLANNKLCGFDAIEAEIEASDDSEGWPVEEFLVGTTSGTSLGYPILRAPVRHFVLRVGNKCVDWTIRQFVPNAPVPLVFDKDALPDAIRLQ